MHPIRRSGLGTSEIVAFLALLGIGAVLCVYLNQKPQIVQRTIVIEKDAPVPASPAPAPKPVAVAPAAPAVQAAFKEEPELPETVVVVTPPPPACVAIAKKLRIAQQAAVQAGLDLAAAKQSALDRWHQSTDYQLLETDLAVKKKAKDDALAALKEDNAAGNDADHDSANFRAASLAWATQMGLLNRLESQTVVDDPGVKQKLQDLKDIRAEILRQKSQMEDYIHHEITSVCDKSGCQIDDVRLDLDASIIQVDMTPLPRIHPGAMADAAMNNIGAVLETLSKSPFPWERIKFRMLGENDNAVQYQFTYAHSDIVERNFELLHVNSLLYRPIHTADLQIGTRGILLDVKIMNIVDDENMIVWLDESDDKIDDILRPVWIRGISTAGRVDEADCDIMTPLVVTKTVRYLTVSGAYKTIYMLEPTGTNENVVIGDYYDNAKLVAIADDIWLNAAIDQLQGRPALPSTYVRGSGTKAPEFYNTLEIGGYSRGDGSVCPAIYVHSPHPVNPTEPNPPSNRPQQVPLYNSSSPLIRSAQPQTGF